MQIAPKPWTHHHTHRIFHISMGLCFAFITLVVMMGFLSLIFNADAFDVVSPPRNVLITALVGGISPGPIEPGAGGPPPPVAPNSVTLQAEPVGKIKKQTHDYKGNLVNTYLFTEQNLPEFSGTVTLPNSWVFLSIEGPQNYNTSFISSSSGHWDWKPHFVFSPGIYKITASVYNNSSSQIISTVEYFIAPTVKIQEPETPPSPPTPPIANPPAGGTNPGNNSSQPALGVNQLFGIFLQIPQSFLKITEGNKIVVLVNLFRTDKAKQFVNQEILYKITNDKNQVILEANDNVVFNPVVQFRKIFNIVPSTPAGWYTVIATSTYSGVTSSSSARFYLNLPPLQEPTVPKAGLVFFWQGLVVLLTTFAGLTFVAYHQIKLLTHAIRKHGEDGK